MVTTKVPSEYVTNLDADVAAACASSPTTCSSAPPVFGGDPPEGGAWLGLIISALLPILLIGAFLFFMFRQAQGTNNQAMSFGKSRARMFLGNKTVVTFQDVAGVDEAKTELQEVVEFLKYPEKFNSARRAHPARRAAGGPARHRQDAARPSRRRRGRRALLQHLRL